MYVGLLCCLHQLQHAITGDKNYFSIILNFGVSTACYICKTSYVGYVSNPAVHVVGRAILQTVLLAIKLSTVN